MTARNVHQWLITAPAPVFDVLLDITKERSDQEDAGYTPEHDDARGVMHLLLEADARIHPTDPEIPSPTRELLVEAAALLVATIELIDREARAVL